MRRWVALLVMACIVGCQDGEVGTSTLDRNGQTRDGGIDAGRDRDGGFEEDGGLPLNGEAEQRCLELGDACNCSEPLNTDEYTTINQFINPSDSDAKQCAGETSTGESVWMTNEIPGLFRIDAESRMPAGNKVDYVWTQTGNNGTLTAALPSTSTRRMCARLYQNFSDDYEGTHEGACTNNKVMTPPKYPGTAFYLTQADGGGWKLAAVAFSAFSANISSSADVFSHHDCKNQWCRFEVCVSGNVRAGTNLSVEGEVVALNDGRKATFAPTFLGNAPGPAEINWPYVGYREGTCKGTRSLSHVMVAEWPSDQGQHIGPAYEVERMP